MTSESEKEDIEASEAANIDLLERPLSKLKAAMGELSRDSDAWMDFAATFDEMLHRDVKGGTFDVGVPQDLWDCWMQVANGQSQDYDMMGTREIDDRDQS
jgi:hypothetical protein